MRSSARAAVLALALALDLAPRLAAEQLPIRSYTTADGLANDKVGCIVQDRYGFLWFCTQEGLSRFDGHAFATFGRENGLASLAVLDFIETGDGEYWVATGRGLCRLDALAARCEAQALGGGGTLWRVQALLKDVRGRLWVGTSEGLFRSEAQPRHGAFRAVTLDPTRESLPVFALAESPDGSVWVATGNGLWRILPDGRQVFHEVESGHGNSLCGTVRADARGRIWIGHFGAHAGVTVLAYLPAAALPAGALPTVRAAAAPPECPADLALLALGSACLVTRSPFPRQGGTGFAPSSDGSLWASTLNAGLLHFERTSMRRYTTEQGLSSNAARSVLEDRSGDVWVGTESRGVMRWARRGLVSYGEADGISPVRIMSVFTGPGGNVYALNSRGLLNRFDGRGFEAVTPNVVGSMTFRYSYGQRRALQARAGDWWMASDQGLQRFTGIHELQDLRDARPAPVLSSAPPAGGAGPIFEDSRGDVWAGTEGHGLVRWQRGTGTVRSYVLPEGLARSSQVTAFAEDRTGTVWVGLGEAGAIERFRIRASEHGGLVRIRGDRPELVVLDRGPREPDVRWLHCDRAGRLWFAAGRGGLGRIDDPTVPRPAASVYGKAQGLSSESVNCVTEDRWGRIYAGTNLGVDRLEVATGRIRNFGIADGLVASDVTSAASDGAGRLWFGTPAGLSMLQPEEETRLALPGVRIMSVRTGGIARALPGLGALAVDQLELAAEDAPIEIAFSAVAPTPGWKRQYRFRLEGADRGWSAPTGQHSVNYARLAPGAYRFRVQAWSAEGGPSAEPSFVAFRVLPPVWRRGWFLTVAGAGAALLALALLRYRVRMLVEVERVRTGIATDLHDDIGSTVSRMALLSEVVKAQVQETHPEAARILEQIGASGRELVDSTSDIVWAVDPRRDDVASLAARVREFGAGLFEAKGIAWEFEASAEADAARLDPEQRRQLYLVFKEALHNVVRHAAGSRASVSLAVLAGHLRAEIRDDGRGFTEAEQAARLGHGLDSMRARAARLGGQLEVHSTPGAGTRLVLLVPLRGRGA